LPGPYPASGPSAADDVTHFPVDLSNLGAMPRLVDVFVVADVARRRPGAAAAPPLPPDVVVVVNVPALAAVKARALETAKAAAANNRQAAIERNRNAIIASGSGWLT